MVSLRLVIMSFLGALLIPVHAVIWRADVEKITTKHEGEMKHVGKLLYTPLRVFGGSCVLLNEHWVMTSKHGTEKWSAGTLHVSFPALGEKVHEVRAVHLHPQYDVALLELKKKVSTKRSIVLSEKELEAGELLWLGGFGLSGPIGNVSSSGEFYAGHNRLNSIKKGRLNISLSKPEDESVEKDEAILAIFDSGSPVFVKGRSGWELAGIAATEQKTQKGKHNYGDQGNYAQVRLVKKWAQELMKK